MAILLQVAVEEDLAGVASLSNIAFCVVMLSLDRQKDINRNSSVAQLIYLKIINIILITNERVLNNMIYYLLKSHCLRKPGRVKRWGSADFLQINTN